MASQMDTWKIMQIVIPWAISFVSICVTFYVAYMTKQTQKMLSLNEKKIQQIDSNLEHLREDLVRFYSAFSTKLDIENPIIRINTAFKGCSSLEKISVLPRIYHN